MRVRSRGNLLQGLHEEEKVLVVVSDLGDHKVVSSSIVPVKQVPIALVLPMSGIADGVPELRLNILPIIKFSINYYMSWPVAF